jgi:hypothetical protein
MPVSQSVDVDNLTATVVVGEGVAGTPTGGILTVQGADPGGALIAWISDSTGDPLNSQNQNLYTADIINTGSQFRAQSVTTTAAEALGAATILANRKFIQITPTNGTIYYGTSSSVTTTTGTPLFSNQTLTIALGPSVHLWVISAGTVDTRVMEGS